MMIKGKLTGTAAAMLLMAGGAFADAVLLKNGEKLKGKILRETPTDVTISVSVTSSIKDDVVVKKADVEMIERIPPDEESWLSLASMGPGQDSMEAEEYESVITTLSSYVDKFPRSAHVAEAKLKIDRFQNELKRVESGQLKLDGQWMDRTKVVEERFQVGGRILLNRMKRLASSGQGIEAMQVFEVLEKNYGGSASYPDAIVLARQILQTLNVAIEDRKAWLRKRVERDKMRLTIAQGAEREKLEAIFKQERESMDAIAEVYAKSGTKWLPIAYVTDKNVGAIATTISSELTRCYSVSLEKMRLSMIGAQTAATALASRDLASAEKALTEATGSWPANELAMRLAVQLADAKKAQALAKAAIEAAAKATPTPLPRRTP